ncbi:DUF2478 domain-containing protein [Nioella nitratireducens]|uniref:DUF2478 domain-containing protein n=1 Tax=Nioella nitratireducens TaxID=1287720 RepID=UPI0008FD0D86|nr:DUF2478 domain-containing protein [Nioella nitratireducens]
MNIAYTMAPGRGDTDLVLFTLADRLRGLGYRCCGTVQINSERADTGPCDMDVKVLPDGPVLRISQSLGRASKGCRLDPNALEAAVGHVGARFAGGADCLIVNKFGKHEAEGRGMRTVIAEALSRDIPVLVGLNSLNQPAFDAFTAGMAVQLDPEVDALLEWLQEKMRETQAAA